MESSGPRPGKSQAEMRKLAKARFPDRYRAGQLDRLTTGKVARQVKLADQYRAKLKGDVARRLDLHNHVTNIVRADNRVRVGGHVSVHLPQVSHGGHYPRPAYYHGRISPHFSSHSFQRPYYGHSFFGSVSWYPHWRPWVHWSWHHRCHSLWDPRPIWCRPVIYHPCRSWVWYRPPVWVSLPVVSSGTWVDVQPVVVVQQYDLQLLAVRFVDPGHPEEKLGPRYRIWFRNNSARPLVRPFDVVLLASPDERLVDGLPQAGVRVTSIEAGDTQSVDVRLPMEVYSMGRDREGKPTPFATLHVMVDAAREISETTVANNGAAIPRDEVLLVDPAAFELEPTEAAAGSEIVLAGEGFGPLPGQVLVHLAGLELEGEILGWYDLGVRLNLPKVPLAAATDAEVIVIRGDGAATNPLKITVLPPQPAGPALNPPQPK